MHKRVISEKDYSIHEDFKEGFSTDNIGPHFNVH